MTVAELIGVKIEPEKAVELMEKIVVCARATEEPTEEEMHYFHSRAEKVGYKVEQILHEAGLCGAVKQEKIGGIL